MLDDYEEENQEIDDIQHLFLPTKASFESIKVGRSTDYTENHPQMLFDYFNRPLKYIKKEKRQVSHSVMYFDVEKYNPVPSIAGFCRINGMGRTTFWAWVHKYKEFKNVYEWGKTVIEETITQRLMDGSVDSKNVIVLNHIMNKYDKDLMALPIEALDNTIGVEKTPERKKGYDLSDIDRYCKQPDIETTATEVEDGKA